MGLFPALPHQGYGKGRSALGIDRTLVGQVIAQRIDHHPLYPSRTVPISVHRLHHVGMGSDDQVRPAIEEKLRQILLGGFGKHLVLASPMHAMTKSGFPARATAKSCAICAVSIRLTSTGG